MRWQQASRTLALALTCATLVTACDPDEVPDQPNEASASIHVSSDAEGKVIVALGGKPDDEAIAALVDSIDGAVFDGHPATGAVGDNGGGIPLLEFRSTGVFEPGPAPTVAIDTRQLCDDLMATGVTDLEVWMSMPRVDTDSSITPEHEGETWTVRSCSESPAGTVVLRPDPGRFWLELLLVSIVVLANVALALIGSRGLTVPRWVSGGLSGLAVAVFLVLMATAGLSGGEQMEVAGRMSHAASLIYFFVATSICLFGPIAAVAQPFYWRLPKERRPKLRRRPSSPATPA